MALEASTNADAARVLGKSNSYAQQYKNRLLGQGVIEENVNDVLLFQMPLIEEFLKGQQR